MGISAEEGIVSSAVKVKVLKTTTAEHLENSVNSWLRSQNVAIRDIIYQHSITTEDEVYSCMIIYT